MSERPDTLFKVCILIAGILISKGFCLQSQAQTLFSVERGIPESLVTDVLKGKDIRVRNITFKGNPDAIAKFEGNIPNPPFRNGIVMSTGVATQLAGANENPKTSTALATVGDRKLDQLANTRTFDAASLEFEFMPYRDSVALSFVFASEEYAEHVGSTFTDPILIFISGPGLGAGKNFALLPGTNQTININQVNITQNRRYYIDNNPFLLTGKPNPTRKSELDQQVLKAFQYDGMTKPFEVGCRVTPMGIYRIRIAIADAGDGNFDSALLLEGGSFRSLEQAKHAWARDAKVEKMRADSLAKAEAIQDSLDEIMTAQSIRVVDDAGDQTQQNPDSEDPKSVDMAEETELIEPVEEDTIEADGLTPTDSISAEPAKGGSAPAETTVETTETMEVAKPDYFVVIFEPESYFVPKEQEILLAEIGQTLKQKENLKVQIFIPRSGDAATNDLRFDLIRLELLKSGAQPTQLQRTQISFSMGTVQPMHRAELMVTEQD